MNSERQRILSKLMHRPQLSFNELWGKEGASNTFAYHLKVLEEDGFVEKKDEKYALTHEGKKFVTYVSGATGKKTKQPLLTVLIVVYDEKTDKFLMQRRCKEPFYGYWGYIGGKMEFDQFILECAAAELKEETGLECDLELSGLSSYKTFNNDNLSFNHQIFRVRATNPRGELIKETREGKNSWLSREEIKKLDTFLGVKEILKTALEPGFHWLEADRFQENDKFVDMHVHVDKKF